MANYLEIFNQHFMPAVSDTIDQRVEMFNAVSNGAITLAGSAGYGNFIETSFYDLLGAPVLFDANNSNDDNTIEDVAQGKIRSVNIAAASPVKRYNPIQLAWLNKPTAEAVMAMADQMAAQYIQLQLNSALYGAVAAISQQGVATIKDVSAGSVISQSTLNDTDALFGDHSGMLSTRVMTGNMYHKLIGQALTNTERLFNYNGVAVVDILGKRIVVTDSPALVGSAGSPPTATEKVLTLVQGAIAIKNGDIITSFVDSLTKQSISTGMAQNYKFELGVKGYSWTGTDSPITSELRTGSNWTKAYASVKNCAGVLTIGDAS